MIIKQIIVIFRLYYYSIYCYCRVIPLFTLLPPPLAPASASVVSSSVTAYYLLPPLSSSLISCLHLCLCLLLRLCVCHRNLLPIPHDASLSPSCVCLFLLSRPILVCRLLLFPLYPFLPPSHLLSPASTSGCASSAPTTNFYLTFVTSTASPSAFSAAFSTVLSALSTISFSPYLHRLILLLILPSFFLLLGLWPSRPPLHHIH